MSSKEKGICAHPAPPRRRLAPRGSPPPRCSSGTRQAPFERAVTIRRKRGGAALALPPSLKRPNKWSPHGPGSQFPLSAGPPPTLARRPLAWSSVRGEAARARARCRANRSEPRKGKKPMVDPDSPVSVKTLSGQWRVTAFLEDRESHLFPEDESKTFSR